VLGKMLGSKRQEVTRMKNSVISAPDQILFK